jgi:hypothetical protein
VIWVFDTSGALQKIFGDLHVHASDATFQAVRDFQMPNVVFIGEDVSLKNFQTLTNRIFSKDERLEAVVFLRQKQFPEGWSVQVASTEQLSKNVSCDPNSPLLLGLNKLDMMNMVSRAVPAKLTKRNDRKWKVDSYISEPNKDEKQMYSYLAVVRDKKLTTVYCQLPLTKDFSKDPRSSLLLRDLLEFVFENRDMTNN